MCLPVFGVVCIWVVVSVGALLEFARRLWVLSFSKVTNNKQTNGRLVFAMVALVALIHNLTF